MRPVFGLTESDESILRLLRDSGISLKPGGIHYNLERHFDTKLSRTTIHRRLPRLAYAGLIILDDEESSRYVISELGKRFLQEDLTDDEVMEVSQRIQEGPPDED